MVLENTDGDARRPLSDKSVTGGVKRLDGTPRALAEVHQVRIDHRLRAGKLLTSRAIGVDWLYRQARLGHLALPDAKDTSHRYRDPSPVRRVATLALSLVFALVFACGTSSPFEAGTRDAGLQNGTGDFLRALTLTETSAPLPARPVALALAQSIETKAVREGVGSRAVQLHALAAALVERVWRVQGQDQDALQAIDLFRAASRFSGTDGACDAALRAAHLAGERADDASVAYAELHRQKLRFGAMAAVDSGAVGSCRGRIDRGLELLAAFRPPPRVIDAIEEGLQGEGAIAPFQASGWDAAAAPAHSPARIVHIDSWPGNDSARVVVVLDRPAGYRAGDEAVAGSSGARTFLDLDGVDLGAAPEDSRVGGILTRVRSESTNTGSRVLLELDGQAWRRVFHMQEPYRIVVDVTRHPPGAPSPHPRDVSRVVLDPGHGGKDRGAVGPGGIVEKDVALDVGHRVARVLMMHGVEVLLTRDDDRFISLEERTARANAFSADLFVSIHCNASEGRVRRGVETYILDTTRDEIAARVAARENDTTAAASEDLTAMLGSMRLADQAQRSARFARLLQRSALAALQMRYADTIDGGIHVAGFYVLVGATMPSVLFETSYISNALEEQRLSSDDYRQLLADGIANAVKAYREGR